MLDGLLVVSVAEENGTVSVCVEMASDGNLVQKRGNKSGLRRWKCHW